MIAKLRGVVDSIGDGYAIIDVNGIGYLIFCSGRTREVLSSRKAAVTTLLIETHVREDHIHLYGFAHEEEREWFKLLTTVQGVGMRVALAILTVLSGDELIHALYTGDKAMIAQAPGVGPKLATRILSELKDKTDGLQSIHRGQSLGVTEEATDRDSSLAQMTKDAVSVLVNLGYTSTDALEAVTKGIKELSGGEVLMDVLIKEALAVLSVRPGRRNS